MVCSTLPPFNSLRAIWASRAKNKRGVDSDPDMKILPGLFFISSPIAWLSSSFEQVPEKHQNKIVSKDAHIIIRSALLSFVNSQ